MLSDQPAVPLRELGATLGDAFCVLGVHGAGWANLIFVGPRAHVIEMALPEPHAIYTAHTAYALDLTYWHVPLKERALHSAPTFHAPVSRVGRVVRQVIRKQQKDAADGLSSRAQRVLAGGRWAICEVRRTRGRPIS